MKLTMLGTGHAMVTECYNTCFVLREGNRCFLVDGGGGNTILSRLKQAQIDWREIGDIFVTHRHVDHLLGIIWMMRLFLQNMNQGKFEGEVRIYAHEEVIRILNSIAHMLPEASGLCMKLFACRRRRMSLSLMKSIIPRLGMPVRWQKDCRLKIWFCIIRRIRILPVVESFMRKRENNIIMGICIYLRIWKQ